MSGGLLEHPLVAKGFEKACKPSGDGFLVLPVEEVRAELLVRDATQQDMVGDDEDWEMRTYRDLQRATQQTIARAARSPTPTPDDAGYRARCAKCVHMCGARDDSRRRTALSVTIVEAALYDRTPANATS